MPYEDDYKMWLEKMLIESNPDWVCDGMYDKEITRNWCVDYCGEDDEYITPKCLHMYYHHIERADRKTESNSEKPNNCEDLQDWKDRMWAEAIVTEPLATCSVNGRPYSECSYCEHFRCTADEPQTNADQHVQRVEYVGNDEKSRCWKCRRFESMHETPISSDGRYFTYVVCTAKECNYEPKDEPQKSCSTCGYSPQTPSCDTCEGYSNWWLLEDEPQTERKER